ncbi:pyridoxamine 5'-phosphate oxidase family protein [Endozoicomonas sp.]|uniref:pyridoxamine 5'-phosphate oxidase family protein n=1 Tax=Endozoicomonas sp. TaxID=1892382 RepID=UPI003AF6D017
MKAHSKQAAELLLENIYCALGTSSLDGSPWVSPVYYSLNESADIFWASSVTSTHSNFIAANPRTFISIFDSTCPPRTATGLYLLGKAGQFIDACLSEVVTRHFQRINEHSQLSGGDFLFDAPERLYCFKPEKAWVLDKPEMIQGHRIDKKTSVPITEIQKALRDIAEEGMNQCFQPMDFLAS